MKLQPGDNPVVLHGLGLPIREAGNGHSAHAPPRRSRGTQKLGFPQPCLAWEDCRCRIYAERPRYCGDFECLLLKSVRNGHTEQAVAFEVVRTAHKRADRVRALLRDLGDTDESLPLSRRFQRTSARIELIGAAGSAADVYADLTLAVHDLNFLLSDAFYPG